MLPQRKHLSGGRLYSKLDENLLFKVDSHKEDLCKELDRLINKLTNAEIKYLPLTKYEYPVKQLFDQSHQIIAEKEKVKATIENLRTEVANLKCELIKNNDQIMLLNKRHKKLLSTSESL
ncbi:5975_t:CDS:2 [Cetraspora pellucida]|uniref:5975_t:CDS:1 n=1 Tax=Cetraspora pellucida TaxID=1433469 RepID=A0A9N8VMX6_9GLOM|nr:5975_t:CDS:2 [Cetraspora pellucida]